MVHKKEECSSADVRIDVRPAWGGGGRLMGSGSFLVRSVCTRCGAESLTPWAPGLPPARPQSA